MLDFLRRLYRQPSRLQENQSDIIELVFEDDDLSISVIPRDGDNAVLCFTGVGHALGGIDVQKEEFIKSGATDGPSIFITDKKRTWGNNLDFKLIQDSIQPYIKNKRVLSLGNSMGGFLSVIATYYFNIDVSISFSAQFSVSTKIVPDEHRWRRYTENIERFYFESLTSYCNEQTLYYFFSGSDDSEKRHWSKIPRKRNISNVVFDGIGHNVCRELKEAGILNTVIQKCYELEDPLKVLNKHFAYHVVK